MAGGEVGFELGMTPHGVVMARPYGGEERWASGVVARFAESEAAGLVALCSASVPHGAHGSVHFWRDLASSFLRSLCHVTESASLSPAHIEEPSHGQNWPSGP